jgi:hypothetical protein
VNRKERLKYKSAKIDVIGRCDYYERAYVPGPCANPLHALGSGNHLQHPHLPGIMMEKTALPEQIR